MQIATAAISIHVPREGHDLTLMAILSSRLLFQSTCPARGTTAICKSFLAEAVRISIHVPREGHDKISLQQYSTKLNFNPRAPRGARPFCKDFARTGGEFQSTCPARGTTKSQVCRRPGLWISIHVPREGHDDVAREVGASRRISIHVPREGHD